MPTNVKPEAQSETETTTTPLVDPNQAKVDALLADVSVQADTKLFALYQKILSQEKIEGGKWYSLIVYYRDNIANVHEEKEGNAIVLKTLLQAGKTYSSAQSIRSYITKMAKPDNSEMLEKLNKGLATVRETRAFGRKAQSAPSRSLEDKFNIALGDAVRFAVELGYSEGVFTAKANDRFANYIIVVESKQAAAKKDEAKS